MLVATIVVALGLVAGAIGGIVGFGASIILLPVLTIAFGGLQAVPIMAVAALMGNLARVLLWWRVIDWRECGGYAVAAIPASALGAGTLLALPPGMVDAALGVVFIVMVPLRHALLARNLRIGLRGLVPAGLVVGYVTGVVASTGPLSVPLFLAYGLVKGAFIGTEAAASLAMYVTKVAVFGRFGALPPDVLARGVLTGAALMAGTYLGKRLLAHLDHRQFHVAADAALLVAGSVMIAAALR